MIDSKTTWTIPIVVDICNNAGDVIGKGINHWNVGQIEGGGFTAKLLRGKDKDLKAVVAGTTYLDVVLNIVAWENNNKGR